jgi:hypothetical protein
MRNSKYSNLAHIIWLTWQCPLALGYPLLKKKKKNSSGDSWTLPHQSIGMRVEYVALFILYNTFLFHNYLTILTWLFQSIL